MQTKVTVEKKKEAETGDIFYPGNIVESKSSPYIVLVTGGGNRDEEFAGIILQSYKGASRSMWYCSETWTKDYFKQFHGKITWETKDE